MKNNIEIKFSSFLKRYFSLYFTWTFFLAITGVGYLIYYIMGWILSGFEINGNIMNIICISSVIFLIGIYVAYIIAKEEAINSESIKQRFEKEKLEADIYFEQKKNQAELNSEAINQKLENTKLEANIYCEQKKNQADKFFKEAQEELSKVIEDEKIYKPFLAQIYSDYLYYLDLKVSDYLEYKRIPAQKAADEVKIIAKEKRNLTEKLKIIEHQLLVYENAFPWLEDFKEVTVDELNEIVNNKDVQDEYEILRKYLSPEEYQKMSTSEKYQLALDRYKNSNKKTNWQIGIDFERYIGYLYEIKGYSVIYNGAIEKLEDMGRDLIATKGENIVVIQCKNWSKQKTIHEKHVFQLYGTMISLKIDNPSKNIKGEFITTAKLSEKAKLIAEKLNIKIVEDVKYDKNYPCIKCNISRKDKTKIYHLPFDQQYDKVDIEIQRGEKYVGTVLEAEQLGFRRAYKWVPEK